MRVSKALGWVIISIVAAAVVWLVVISPTYQNYLLTQARWLRPVQTCKWIAPWDDPSFWLLGWSSPQNGTLWSNARSVHIVFLLPGAPTGTQLGIRYAALTADAEVHVNGVDAGPLSKTTHEFNYLLERAPPRGAVDVQVSISHVPRRWYDGRYAGVLLTTVRACPSRI